MDKSIVSTSRRFTLYTWSKQKEAGKRTIVRARGVYFWDEQGKKYLDFASQIINVNLGHRHPKLVKAIAKQAEELAFATPSFAAKPKAELGKLLVKLTKLGKVFFTTSGAEANENAMMIARQFSRKAIILGRTPSYHGATYGTRTAGRDPVRRVPPEQELPGFHYFSAPKCFLKNDPTHRLCCQTSLKELKTLIKRYPGKIAAVILEPIPGGQGVLIPSKFYLSQLIRICRQNGILTIFDEVMTGFGRTGKWFAYEHWGAKPDIVTLAKGINSGYLPLGAVVVSKKIANYFWDHKLLSGATNSGHPLAVAAGVAAVQAYHQQHLLERSARLGKLLLKNLGALQKKYPLIADVRGLGLFCAVEFSAPETFTEIVFSEAYNLGLFIYRRFNFVIIAPPLIVTEAQLLSGIKIFEKALKRAIQKPSE